MSFIRCLIWMKLRTCSTLKSKGFFKVIIALLTMSRKLLPPLLASLSCIDGSAFLVVNELREEKVVSIHAFAYALVEKKLCFLLPFDSVKLNQFDAVFSIEVKNTTNDLCYGYCLSSQDHFFLGHCLRDFISLYWQLFPFISSTYFCLNNFSSVCSRLYFLWFLFFFACVFFSLTMPIMRMFVDWWFYREILRRVCIHARATT